MKIKKAFDICKKSKIICLFTDGTTQYLSDGNAVYPLTALPELDEDYFCQLYDINDSQREKIHFKINEPLPYEFSFADSTPDESAAMLHDINIQLEGVGVCIPVMTERGIKFIKSVYLAPLSDTDSRDIHYFLRQTSDGREYFAVKVGLLLYAIITPVNIINQPFVDKLFQLYHYSKLALENSGEAEK